MTSIASRANRQDQSVLAGSIPRTHLIVRVSSQEIERITPPSGERVLELWFDTTSTTGPMLRHTAWNQLDALGYEPPQLAVDLFRVAAAAFTADLRIKRAEAFDGWTRDLALYLPVSDVPLWDSVRGPLLKLLAFLTGDHWEIAFYPATCGRPEYKRRKRPEQLFPATAVCLLSGGLDSFIGASNALANSERLALVSHYASGTATASSPAQEAVVEALRKQYNPDALRHLSFYVNAPKKALTGVAEETTRSRSIIFLALGVLAASALGPGMRRLIVPENGLISLNAPLTDNRLGSLSTKTTHPHTIALFRAILNGLDLDVTIETPCQLTTKGEMLTGATDLPFVKRWARDTVSCARPTQARYQRGNDPRARRKHCGYCVPCIIRRAAMYAGDLDTVDDYRRDLHTLEVLDEASRHENVLAFQVAIARLRSGGGPADVLASGPLGEVPYSVADFIDVHRRGLEEVAALLQRSGRH